MKKLLTILLAIALTFIVSGCADKKYYDKSINVIFYSGKNASTVETLKNLEPNSKIQKPVDPTRPGYEFIGWYKEATYKNPWDFNVDKVGNESITLFAKWNAIEYKITYILNGGNPLTGTYPTTFTLDNASLTIFPSSVRQTGYSFAGWYLYDWKNAEGVIQTKPGDNGINNVPAGTTHDLVVYAHWKAIESVIVFDVNFPEAEGKPTAPKSLTMTYGEVIKFVQLVSEKYNFIGWNSKADGTGDFFVNGNLYTRTQKTTVYAIWEKK